MKNSSEIMAWLLEQIPARYALDWDNVGLLAGRTNQPVDKVYVALDPTELVIERAVKARCQMLITHHPLIFGSHGLRQVNDQDFVSKRVLTMIENHMAYGAFHTNYDVLRMADLTAKRMGMTKTVPLEETQPETRQGIGWVGDLAEPMTLEDCCRKVKEAFGLSAVRLFGSKDREVQRIAMCPGSGKGMTLETIEAHAQVLITGDIGHHDGLDALSQGIAIIDAGHHGLEHIFVEDMAQCLTQAFPELTVMLDQNEPPFETI